MKVTNNLENLGVFKDFSDGTLKTVFSAGTKQIIEITLLVNKENMDVVCAPTHHFCNLGCKMCHLTNKGLNKQMKAIDSSDFIASLIKGVTKPDLTRRTDKKKLLISFMGVGEPLLNLKLIEDVFNCEGYLKSILGYEEIGYAVATMMPTNLSKLTELVDRLNIPLKLHFSLHTPIDQDRFDLIPATKVSVEDALAYLVEFRKRLQANPVIMNKYTNFHRTNDPVEIHYTLIDKINDEKNMLEAMCELLEIYKIPIKFIRFNPTTEMHLSENEDLWVRTIKNRVKNLRVKTYTPPGREIGSSCGEFTKHYYHEEIESQEQVAEFEEWKRKHQLVEERNDYPDYIAEIIKLTEKQSKDPSTKVATCIVSHDNEIISIGYNGPPNGWDEEIFSWQRDGDYLETKYPYVCHSEMNAIVNYNGSKAELLKARIYTDIFPCNECAKLIIQYGIKEVIYLSDKYSELEGIIAAKRLFDKCGIMYKKLSKPK